MERQCRAKSQGKDKDRAMKKQQKARGEAGEAVKGQCNGGGEPEERQ